MAVAELQHDEALNLITFGRLKLAEGQLDDARRSLVEARESLYRLVRSDPANAEYRNDLGVTLNTLGLAIEALGERREAIALYGLAIESHCAAFAGNPRMAPFWRSLGESYSNLTLAARDEETSPEGAKLLYEVARDLASCIASMAEIEAELTDALRSERRRCSERAMEALRGAIAAGFRDIERISEDAALDPLRSRADFQEMFPGRATPADLTTRRATTSPTGAGDITVY